jgi:hypothetical protein
MSFLSCKKLVFFITNPVQRFSGLKQYTITSNILLGRGKTISHSYLQDSQALQDYQFSFLFFILIVYEPVLPNILTIPFFSMCWQLPTLWAFLDLNLACVNAQCVCNFGLGFYPSFSFKMMFQ